jgi:DNA-binding CsgD family transcriptional regulator
VAWRDFPKEFREIIEQMCTPAERDVMRRISDGASLGQIARARGCTKGTVRTLRNRAETKIRAEFERRSRS